MQTGLLTSLCATVDLVVYLADVSADAMIEPSYTKCQPRFLTALGTVGYSSRCLKNSDGMTVIYYSMRHSPSYTRTR